MPYRAAFLVQSTYRSPKANIDVCPLFWQVRNPLFFTKVGVENKKFKNKY